MDTQTLDPDADEEADQVFYTAQEAAPRVPPEETPFFAGGNSRDHRRLETALQNNLHVQCLTHKECSKQFFFMGMVVCRTSEQEPQTTRANLAQIAQEVKFVGEPRVPQSRCTSERFSPMRHLQQSIRFVCVRMKLLWSGLRKFSM